MTKGTPVTVKERGIELVGVITKVRRGKLSGWYQVTCGDIVHDWHVSQLEVRR